MRRSELVGVVFVVAVLSYVILGLHSGAAAPSQVSTPLVIRLDLQPDERITGATAGNLEDGLFPSLVMGTAIPPGYGRVHLLHWTGKQYERVWVFRNVAGVFESAMIRAVTNNKRNDLVTLWRGGQGGYLDVLIFEWDGRTYRKIWQLSGLEKEGQLTQGASLIIRRVDDFGGVELVIRAPNVQPGESSLGAVSHQVSIYRWNAATTTFLLHKRFVDAEKSHD